MPIEERNLMPGETTTQALSRRIKMHEFLMSGGVMTGYVDGVMAYSEPIVAEEHVKCPWHLAEDCVAWVAIREGHGHWTSLQAELDVLTEAYVEGEQRDDETMNRINELVALLKGRPAGWGELREKWGTAPLSDAASHARRDSPWGGNAGVGAGLGGRGSRRRFKPEDARDKAFEELSAEQVPDEIVFDGDEEGEDEDPEIAE